MSWNINFKFSSRVCGKTY